MMASSSAYSRSGNAGTKRVPQPFERDAGTKRVSEPFEIVDRASVNVGTFNLGLYQSQIESKYFETGTLRNFRRIIAKGFENGELHLLNLCEVGGHKQGLPACCILMPISVDAKLEMNGRMCFFVPIKLWR